VFNVTADKWVEINTEAVINNLQEVKTLLDEKTRIIAVVKANAYGHGAAGIARILENNGVNYFAVTYLEEALQLRRSGVHSDIMLLSPLSREEQVAAAVENNITLTISSRYDSNLVNQVLIEPGHKVKVHLKIETGLGRFGVQQQEALEICELLAENSCVCMEGIYTHMADAVSSSYTHRQFQLFSGIIEELAKEGYSFSLRHCANSAVCLKYPHMHLDAVRIGTLLSGQHPTGISGKLELNDPFAFKCRIISLRRQKSGSYLGYYRTHRLKKSAQIAVIPAGYIDGVALEVGNKPSGVMDLLKNIIKMILAYMGIARFSRMVILKGKSIPIRGKVFMQMALLEIPESENVAIGDIIEIPVRKTLVAREISRLYHHEGELVSEDQLTGAIRTIMGG